MDSLNYIKELAKKTSKWYKKLGVGKNNIHIPTRQEWAEHFDVDPKLWTHVLMEMNENIF